MAFVVICDLVALAIVQWKFVPFVIIPVAVVSAIYLVVMALATRRGDVLFYFHQAAGLASFLLLIHLANKINIVYSVLILMAFFAFLANLFHIRKTGYYKNRD
ncbi:MAG: hypothetical protein ACYC0F_02970 [Rhodanobacter sp.]